MTADSSREARVYRGRKASIGADREASARLLEVVANGAADRAIRVWAPHRQVAFGRRDANAAGYEAAREAAADRGFPPVERSVGGRAVAYDGTTTLAFARAEPVADFRRGTDDRYDRLAATLETALSRHGLPLEPGEPADAFCPGSHSFSLQSSEGARKVVGIAQRVRANAALVSGLVIVDNAPTLAGVLEPVYAALGVDFDPAGVGALTQATAVSVEAIRQSLEDALVGEAVPTIESLEP